MKKGFTLVELSIVLVIIGLLVGGILAAQSMIQTTRINTQIKQVQQIDIGVRNFQTKYNTLPGDSSFHSPPGDGDGRVENSDLQNGTGPGNSSRFFDGETSNFWPHLQQDGFYKNEYAPFSNDGTSGIRSTINMPVAVLGTKTGMVFTVSGTTNQFTLANYDGTTTTNHENINPEVVPSLDVGYLYSLDTKIDDGLARSGKITISGATPACYSASAPNPYIFSNTTKCIAGITTGN